jgi:hypothetical protein
MLSLEEAIKRYERQTEELYNALPCDGCAFRICKEEHRQLAEWLKELKLYREIIIDRPCEVCEFHKTGSCSRWTCVFEE